MIALIWILLAWILGWILLRYAVADPQKIVLTNEQTANILSTWPSFIFQIAASLCIGLLVTTWLTYFSAYGLNAVLPSTLHPLLIANLLLMTVGITLFGIHFSKNRFHLDQSNGPTLIRSLQRKTGLYFVFLIIFWVILSSWLMRSTFYQVGDYLHAGFSVFSDFAPHTALTASFSEGRNWPTQYPHFGGDGIAYHFMFYFLCANLHYLGLPIDWAINLPSILSMISFCLLLGTLAYRLTANKVVYFLTPLLLFFRSSFAFWTHVVELMQRQETPKIIHIVRQLLQQRTFIGNNTHDDWGLWGVNVYANQRHFLFGLSIAFIVILLMLPDLKKGLENMKPRDFFKRSAWLILNRSDLKRIALALLVALLLPYWHGSALIWLLLILLPLALFSVNRLGFFAIALASIASAMGQSYFFTGHATQVVKPALFFGFLAQDPSFVSILKYLLSVTGLLFPLVIAAFCFRGIERRIIMISLAVPVLFTFTVSLTPDITVNHKYLIASIAGFNIFISELLIRLWQPARRFLRAKKETGRPMLKTILSRSLAVILIGLLTITGIEEWIIVRNINSNTVSIDQNEPVSGWIRDHTKPDALFVTAPYHYNSFFLSGRSTFLGHSYYAWSAGHDTASRHQILQEFLSADTGDLEKIRLIIENNALDYLLLDDTLRNHEDYSVNESFFNAHFLTVATFPAQDNTKLYDLQQIR